MRIANIMDRKEFIKNYLHINEQLREDHDHEIAKGTLQAIMVMVIAKRRETDEWTRLSETVVFVFKTRKGLRDLTPEGWYKAGIYEVFENLRSI